MEKSYNECYICGIVLNEPEHYLTINGEDFFRTLVSVKRKAEPLMLFQSEFHREQTDFLI